MKVAFLSGRQENGTILPRDEKFVWKELTRVVEQELKNPLFKGATFLIPIYSKFDLFVLRLAEKMGNPVEYYVPSEDWGFSKLPKHQVYLIERMKFPRHVTNSNTGRLDEMVKAADIVYTLPNTKDFDRFESWLEDKLICEFPIEKMLYQTEEEAKVYHKKLNEQTQIFLSTQQVKQLQDQQLEKSAFEELNKQYGNNKLFDLDDDALPY